MGDEEGENAWKTRRHVTPAKYHSLLSLFILDLLAGWNATNECFRAKSRRGTISSSNWLQNYLLNWKRPVIESPGLPDWSKISSWRCAMLLTTTSKLWSGLRRSKRKRWWNSHLQKRRKTSADERADQAKTEGKPGAAVRLMGWLSTSSGNRKEHEWWLNGVRRRLKRVPWYWHWTTTILLWTLASTPYVAFSKYAKPVDRNRN